MIIKKYRVRENGGTAPFTYQWGTDCPDGVIVEGAGNEATVRIAVDDGTVETGACNVTLLITDANGCEGNLSFPIEFENPPIANDDVVTTACETPVSIQVLDNDERLNGRTFSIVSPPSNGTAIKSGNSVLYTPNENFFGQDTFVYELSNSGGADVGGSEGERATVTVNVECCQVVVDFAGSFRDDNDANLVTQTGTTTHITGLNQLTFSVIFNQNLPDEAVIPILEPEYDNNTFQFSFRTDQDGNYAITVDGDNGCSVSDRRTFLIQATNNPPVAEDDSATSDQDQVVFIRVTDNDYDPDGDDFTLTHINGVQVTGGSTVPVDNGTAEFFAPNIIGFTPDEGFVGTTTYQYTITDEGGLTDDATVTITFNEVDPCQGSVLVDIDYNDAQGETVKATADIFQINSPSYAWFENTPSGYVLIETATGQFTYLEPGDYKVEVTDGQNGCLYSKNFTIQPQ